MPLRNRSRKRFRKSNTFLTIDGLFPYKYLCFRSLVKDIIYSYLISLLTIATYEFQ